MGITTYSIALVAGLIFMTIVFILAEKKKRLDVVDVAWGLVFIVMVGSALFSEPQSVGLNVATLLVALVVIWGTRLAYHIGRRLAKSEVEDKRYTEMRAKWKGNPSVNAYLRIFVSQVLLAFVVCLPVIHATANGPVELSWISLIGLLIWVSGYVIESHADSELRQHIATTKKRGSLMQSGLWRYSRHPNYFGEATQWWGIYIIGCSVAGGVWFIFAPLLITILVRFISGVPLSEKHMQSKSGWKKYAAKTNVFIPFPQKK